MQGTGRALTQGAVDLPYRHGRRARLRRHPLAFRIFDLKELFMLEGDVGSETLAELRKKVTVAEERLSALGEQLRGTINDLAASARDGVDEKT
jgi:hypothetical protein